MVSATAITSVLGLVFWTVAARLSTPEEVGIASTQISAATLLSTASMLALGPMFARFLPRAGGYTGWILRRAYLVVGTLGLLLGAAAVLSGATDKYVWGWMASAVFIAGVPILAIFALQDSALLGLNAARIVPIENAMFAVAKLLLLPVLVSVSAYLGIFAAWLIPAAIAAMGVSIYVFRRHVPPRGTDGVPLPPRPVLWRLLGQQYAGTMLGHAGLLGVPLVVMAILGPSANGYLALPWMIASAFVAFTYNVTQSFGFEVRNGNAVTRHVLKRLFGLLFVVDVIGGLAGLALGPFTLRLLTPEFAGGSTEVLQLVCLSAPFIGVWMLLLVFWWLEGRLGRFAALQGAYAAVLLVSTALLLPIAGVAGAGLGFLLTTVGFGLGCVPPLVRRFKAVHKGHGHIWLPSYVDS